MNEDGSERLSQLLQSTKTGTDSELSRMRVSQQLRAAAKPVLLVQPAVVLLPVDPEDNNHFPQRWNALRLLVGITDRFREKYVQTTVVQFLRPNLDEAWLLNRLMEEVKEGVG